MLERKNKNTKAVRPVAKIAEANGRKSWRDAAHKRRFPRRPSNPQGARAPREGPTRIAAQLGCRASPQALVQKAHALISSKRETGEILTTGKNQCCFSPMPPFFAFLQLESWFLYMGMCFSLCIWTTACIDFKWEKFIIRNVFIKPEALFLYSIITSIHTFKLYGI